MKKTIFNTSFLVLLFLITAYKNQQVAKPEDKTQEGGITLAGVYFCAQTKEIIVVDGDEKTIKKIYYAKGKGKFKAQKITSQKKIVSENPIGEDYQVSFMGIAPATADKFSFGTEPSGKRYIEQKSKQGKEGTSFACISSEINIMTDFNAALNPNVLISRAFAGKYTVENTTDEVEIYTLEMQYAFGFKYKGIDATAIVTDDLSIKMTDPAGKMTYSNFGMVSFLVAPKDKKSFTLNKK